VGEHVEAALGSYRARWPNAQFIRDDSGLLRELAARTFSGEAGAGAARSGEGAVRAKVVLIGTDFETRVWQTLARVPAGSALSYGELAEQVRSPEGARAVGRAVGRNPIAFVVPCHRVVGRDGSLTGYHWGITRKRAIIGWEAGAVRFCAGHDG
jgi:AraC family transcriptional regulator of adaptative response/methylated-DNA-[protein]-cysteine methyltransferase